MRLNFKRLGLVGSRFARAMARLAGLTPARLDMLTLLMKGELCQRDLAAALCVTEPVISKMVRGMMKHGLVRREIPTADRRFRVVSVTTRGRETYASLTHRDWFMGTECRYDAQTLGECMWMATWEVSLRETRQDDLLRVFRFDFEGEQPPEPPYAAIRRHQLQGAFADPERGLEDFDMDWPRSVRERPPPVAHGRIDDPLSLAYAALFRRDEPG